VSAPLYSLDILRLAAATAETPRLDSADGSAERSSRTCGSRMICDVRLDAAGLIETYGHQVNACALGQAAATLLARNAPGRSLAELELASTEVRAFLASNDDRSPDWPGLEVLARARAFPARHAAILLPFETAVEAMKAARP